MSTPDFELTLILARAITLVAALLMLAWAFRYWRRSSACDAQRMFEQLDLIRGELMQLYERLEQRPVVASAPAPMPVTSEPRPTPTTTSPAPRGYEVAARLARSGATCEELVSSCGLSRHEAQLLLRLHGAEARKVVESHKIVEPAKPVVKAKTVESANVADKSLQERRPRLSMVS